MEIWNLSSVMGRKRWRRRDLEDVADVEDELAHKKPPVRKEQPARKQSSKVNH